jgi:hypothetical protein
MTCSINIKIEHSGSGTNAVISFTSSSIDNNYASSSQPWGWGGYPKISDQEYFETKAKPYTLSYLAPSFLRVYGKEMTDADICPMGGNGGGGDVMGSGTIILILAIAAAYYYFVMRK